jgi:hypothetical protein
MSFEGTFLDGKVEPDSPPDIPEGTRVRFEVVSPSTPVVEKDPVVLRPDGKPLNSLNKLLLSLAGTVTDLPSDMARNHDHYIHGTRKK